jgi:AcrR family transcriptional regulator
MARPRQVSDAQILEAARAVFLEQGPGVSTTVIAERLGVSQAALFKRFGTKDELMIAALRPGPEELDALLAWTETGPGPGPIRPQLRELLQRLRDRFAEFLPGMAVLRAAGVTQPERCTDRDPARPLPPVRLQRALAAWLTRAHSAGALRCEAPGAVAYALLGAVHLQSFLAYMAHAEQNTVSDASLDALLDSLWAGLDPREVAP